jgi:trans-AT polyketide synthase, acyltransferase and oxidoreductase domains
MENSISYTSSLSALSGAWQGSEDTCAFSMQDIQHCLLTLDAPIYFIYKEGRIAATNSGSMSTNPTNSIKILAASDSLPAEMLGNPDFKKTYGTPYAYYAGSMANGISSEKMTIAMGNAGFMCAFGTGGLGPDRIESAIQKIQAALPDKPYAFNLLNSPNEPALEQKAVDLFLKYGITTIEASAYLLLSDNLVRYRAAGLSRQPDGEIQIANRIIAKLSRKEVARKFLEPASDRILKQLLEEGKINPEQAELAKQVPMADDITVEADSGGHTDNRPLVCILPAIIALRDEIQAKYNYPQTVRVGAGGGIGTPAAALAAFMLGADYIVTGSINQSCVEAGASEHTRTLLAKAEMTDVAMAPAGDMFEMGVKVQVLKRGTMFAMRGQKLYDFYSRYDSWQEIPIKEREKLENQVFKHNFEWVWEECVRFFSERDPRQIERAENNPKDKMALVFRWYLGLSSYWSSIGEEGREMDYQIWCGPSMGAFNDWVRGTYLEEITNRHAADIAHHIMKGAAFLARVRTLNLQGLRLPSEITTYLPKRK